MLILKKDYFKLSCEIKTNRNAGKEFLRNLTLFPHPHNIGELRPVALFAKRAEPASGGITRS